MVVDLAAMDAHRAVSVESGLLMRAAAVLRESEALLITAGAGMGVDSGLPDFRGPEGFWRAYPALARLGLRFEEMANPAWFHRDPALAWAFYGHRLGLYQSTRPHAGFARLLDLARSRPAGWFVFTSNVDGQFQKAGFDPDRIMECHGSIHHFQCGSPCGEDIWEAGGVSVQVDPETFRARPPLPACPRCGALARPNILMFGDGSWLPARTDAQEARLADWWNTLRGRRARVAVVELGAGRSVPTVRRFSEAAVTELGATLVRLNPREPGVPAGQIGLNLGARDALEHLWP